MRKPDAWDKAELTAVMSSLLNKRPVFHSEADFQHALAWEIHCMWPTSEIRLEYKPMHLKGRIYLDLWVNSTEFGTLAIELKYKTRKMMTVDVRAEVFELADQSAQDQGRYDFLKDVQRLEEISNQREDITGYAILLTNDRSYWDVPANRSTADSEFRLHEGRTLAGQLKWGSQASEGTTKGREGPIILSDHYKLEWCNYSLVDGGGSYNQFRYLIVKVGT